MNACEPLQSQECRSATCSCLSEGEFTVLRGVRSLQGNYSAKFRSFQSSGEACRGFRRAGSERAVGMGRRRGVELYRAPFPLYALRIDPKTGLLIAAGGGGAAKTGIKNGVVRTQGHREQVIPWPRAIPG